MIKLTLPVVVLLLAISCPGQAYLKLHQQAVVVDTHNDIPSASIEKKLLFDSDLTGKSHTDLKRLQQGGVDVQFFSIYCGPEQASPYAFANREIDSVYAWVNRNPGAMRPANNVAQIKQAVKQHKIAATFGVEGGHMIENSLANLDSLYARGARYLTLTWNNSTDWATSAKDETEKKDSLTHKGLTNFGKQVVKRMNDLGMMIDISHNGEQTFWDAINTSTKPVIASHSSVYNICPHRRNLKDDQIIAIAKKGGVIQLNFYAGFLDSNYAKGVEKFNARHKPEIDSMVAQKTDQAYAIMLLADKYKTEIDSIRPPLSKLIEHIDYIVKLVGVDYVGLGADFDGMEAPPLELNSVKDYPLITKALLEKGYSKKDIKKILGGNLIRVYTEVENK
jgi:membrane dipeptidase